METVAASSAACMRGRHRHRSSGVTVGRVRPWVYQRAISRPSSSFFSPVDHTASLPPPPCLPTPQPQPVCFFFFFFFSLSRLPVASTSGWRVNQRRLLASGVETRRHGDCPLGYTPSAAWPPRGPPLVQLPPGSSARVKGLLSRRGRRREYPHRNPHGAWRVYLRPENPPRVRVPLTLSFRCVGSLRIRLSPSPRLSRCVGGRSS